MSDNRQSLADLAKLTEAEPEAPAAETAAPEAEAAEAPEAEAAAPEADAPEADAPEADAPEAETAVPARARSEGGDRDSRGRRGKEEEVNKDGVDTQGPQIQAILREQQL